MPETSPQPPAEQNPALASPVQKLAMLLGEASVQSQTPPSGDPVIAAMWQAVPEALDASPTLHAEVVRWLARHTIKADETHHQGISISQLAGALRARLQYDRLERARGLRGHDDPARWLGGLLHLGKDEERIAKLTVALGFPLNTPHEDRSGPVEVVRQVMAASGGPVPVLDGGTGMLIGLNKIALKTQYPFSETRLVSPGGRDENGKRLWVPGDEQMQADYRTVLAGSRIAGDLLGVDILDPRRDPLVPKLARAALRPVSEIGNRRFMNRFHALAGTRVAPEVVHFSQGDITDPEDMRHIQERNNLPKPRIVSYVTVANQLGDEAIPSLIESGMDLLGDYDDAMVLIVDFAYRDAEDPSVVRLYTHWDPGTYTAIGIYKNDPERRARVLFRYLTSRPTEVIAGNETMMVNGAFVPVREALRTRAAQLGASSAGRGRR
jgi:hypothetical protein